MEEREEEMNNKEGKEETWKRGKKWGTIEREGKDYGREGRKG